MSVSVSGYSQPYLVYQLLQPQWQAANTNSAASLPSSPTGAASSVAPFVSSGGVAISAAVAAFLSGLGSGGAPAPDSSATPAFVSVSSPSAPVTASSSSSFSADLAQQEQGDFQAATGEASAETAFSDASAASPSADLTAAVAAYVSVMQSAPSSAAATTHPGNPAQGRDHALPPVAATGGD